MKILRKILGVLCIIIGSLVLLLLASVPIVFSMPSDNPTELNWNAVWIAAAIQLFFMTVGFLLFRWEHYRLKWKERSQKRFQKKREEQMIFHEERAISLWYHKKKKAWQALLAAREQKKEKAQKETEREKECRRKEEEAYKRQLLDQEHRQISQYAKMHYNQHAGVDYYLWFAFFLILAVGSVLVIPFVIHLERKMLGVITCILTVTFWIGFGGAIFSRKCMELFRIRAFLTTNEGLIYHIKFEARDYKRTSYTKIGSMIHNAEVISAEAKLTDEREAYLHSEEFLAMAEGVINGERKPEKECRIECLNSPQIIREGVFGMKIRYWDEKVEQWAKMKIQKSNEGYEKIRSIIKQRNHQYDL